MSARTYFSYVDLTNSSVLLNSDRDRQWVDWLNYRTDGFEVERDVLRANYEADNDIYGFSYVNNRRKSLDLTKLFTNFVTRMETRTKHNDSQNIMIKEKV